VADLAVDPPYDKIKCPKCGNTESFRETSLRDTYQNFEMYRNGSPHWAEFETGDEIIPLVIICSKCDDETVVWKRTAPISVEDLA
jgi:hypothetical protein